MPITRMTCKFIQPAYYDELLTIKTIIPAMPGRLITFKYEVFNPGGTLINEGDTQLIFIDVLTKKVKTAPPLMIEKLKPYFKF